MAMIPCPNCGAQISDKATKCVHCGYILKEDIEAEKVKRICAECGAELEDGETVCHNCGCPVEETTKANSEPITTETDQGADDAKPQQVEVTGVRVSKKVIIVIVAAIVIAIAAIFTVKYVQQQNAIKQAEEEEAQRLAAEEAERLAEEEAQRIAEEESAQYGEDLQTISYSILAGAVQSESCGSLLYKVWYNCIYEEKDSTTDKYTRRNEGSGSFYSDFNSALSNLFADEDYAASIESIEENKDSVAAQMKELMNPPEDWEDAYEALEDLYDAYLTLVNLVISPSGSLYTFSSNFNSAESEFVDCYEKVELYLE